MTAPVRETLAEILTRVARKPAEIRWTDETPLLGPQAPLDSLALLDVVVSVEERFGVQLSPEDVGPDRFGTFGKLVATVEGRLGRPAGGPG